MREDARFEAFSSEPSELPDHVLLVRPLGPDRHPVDAWPVITERNGREITVYMRTELLPEITVANLFIAARVADLLPEHGACLLHASYVLHEGKELKIDTEYHKVGVNIDDDPDPFSNKPKPIDVTTPATGNTPEIHRPRREGPTIQPPQDKYKLVRQQQVDPAYTRQRTEFMTDSESQTRTQFRPCSRREEVEQVEPESNNNSLFPM